MADTSLEPALDDDAAPKEDGGGGEDVLTAERQLPEEADQEGAKDAAAPVPGPTAEEILDEGAPAVPGEIGQTADAAADQPKEETEIAEEAPTAEAAAEPASVVNLSDTIAPTAMGGTSSSILLKNRFNILPGQPLPELDSPSARAFQVEDRLHPRQREFALICIPGMPVRFNEIDEIVGQEIPGNLFLIESGPVLWPTTNQTCLALIFERPMGGKAADVLREDMPEYQKLDIIRRVVEQGVDGLQQLHAMGITHRAIRPDNMFFTDSERTELVLGEFVSAPPGFDQPVALEPIELAMATEGGRGAADHLADLYAFGATMAAMTQRTNPAKGMSRAQLILSKLEEGSYHTLVGRTLVTATLYEFLRGVLNDDPTLRWDFEQVNLWLGGRRVPPVHNRQKVEASRSIKFGGMEHVETRTLAFMLHEKRDTGLKLIRDGHVDQWLSRGLDDKEGAAAVAGAVDSAAQSGDGNADDVLLSRVVSLLDPDGPIRYRGASFMPDAFGAALAVEVLRDGHVDMLIEAVMKDIPALWFVDEGVPGSATYTRDTIFPSLKEHLHKAAPGFGIERCLYETNGGLPCQSPLIVNDYVTTIKRLPVALDAAEKTADTSKSPIDRHIAAFIGAHYDRDVDGRLTEMADPDESVSILATLKLLARIQGDLGPESLLGLTKWMGGLMGPVINNFRSRSTRREIEGEIPGIVRLGSLPALVDLLDDTQTKRKDAADYAAAVEAFRQAEAEIASVEETMGPNSEVADRTARQAAAVTSIVFMCIIISLMFIAG